MNDTERHNDKENDGIRKVLRRLPRVKASPDFERRLADSLRKDFPGKRATGLFGGFRLPAPAYSFATILVLGAAVYYAFFRTGTIPVSSSDLAKLPESGDVLRSDSQSVQLHDAPAMAIEEKHESREFAGKPDPSPHSRKNKVSSPKDAAASAATNTAVEGKTIDERQQAADVKSASAMQSSAEESAQEISQPELKKTEQEPARGVTNAMPPPPDVGAKQAYPGQRSRVAPKTQMQSNSFKSSSATAQSAASFEAPIDSILRRDSLRADSLRKARADSLK